MPDINLLPEDLRQEEEKWKARKKDDSPPTAYHIPEPGKKKIDGASLPASKERWGPPDAREEKAKIESAKPQPVKASVEPPLAKAEKGRSFFSFLFGSRKNKTVLPEVTPFIEPAAPLVKPQNHGTIEKVMPQSALPPKGILLSQEPVRKVKRAGFFSGLFRKKPVPNGRGKAAPLALARQPGNGAPSALSALKGSAPEGGIFSRSVDVNLLPEGVNLLPLKRIILFCGLAALVGVALVFLIYLGLRIYRQVLEQEFIAIDQKLIVMEKDFQDLKSKEAEAEAWNKRITAVQAVLDRHIRWSIFLANLERTTLPDVYYRSLAVSTNGEVSLEASATDFITAARQYKVFQQHQDIFPEVEIVSWTRGDTGVDFNVSLKLAPSNYYDIKASSDL